MTSDSLPVVIGLVMAAGYSRRFGSADKRVARLADGSSLLRATLQPMQVAFSQLPGSRLSVVLRPDDDPWALGIPGEVAVLTAPRAALGLGASIADAARKLIDGPAMARVDSLAIMLGDMPEVKPETIQTLVKGCGRGRIVRPRYRQVPGHPVFIGRDFWTALLNLEGEGGAKSVLQMNPGALLQVDTDDPGVVADIDTPEQLAQWG